MAASVTERTRGRCDRQNGGCTANESTASWDACAPREASSLPTLARYAEPRRDHNCPSMVLPEQAQRHGGQASTHGPDSRETAAREA